MKMIPAPGRREWTLYAPDGMITFDGTAGLDSKGSAVAKKIILDSSTV